jgi:hypothetical protein
MAPPAGCLSACFLFPTSKIVSTDSEYGMYSITTLRITEGFYED